MGQTKPRIETVLVVDDEAFLRIYLTDILEDAGYRVLEAANADEAIELLETQDEISIVLTDVQMPGSMDGLRLSHIIRDRWPPVKLMVMSGKTHLDIAALPKDVTFFSKPFDPNKLIETMAL